MTMSDRKVTSMYLGLVDRVRLDLIRRKLSEKRDKPVSSSEVIRWILELIAKTMDVNERATSIADGVREEIGDNDTLSLSEVETLVDRISDDVD